MLRYFIWGDIREQSVEEMKTLLEECLSKLGREAVDLLEINIFSDETSYLLYRKERAPEATWVEDPGFPVTYECWRGIPTMAISLPRIMKLRASLRRAVIEHEIGHAVLHNSPEFYIVSIPDNFRRSLPPDLGDEMVLRLIHLLSIAVKDSEVTYLLLSKGITENQIEFALDLLRPSSEELIARKISTLDNRIKFILAYSMLKPIAFASPLIMLEEVGNKVSNVIDNYVKLIQPRLYGIFREFSEKMAKPKLIFREDMEMGYEIAMKLNKAIIE